MLLHTFQTEMCTLHSEVYSCDYTSKESKGPMSGVKFRHGPLHGPLQWIDNGNRAETSEFDP